MLYDESFIITQGGITSSTIYASQGGITSLMEIKEERISLMEEEAIHPSI